MYWAIEPAPVLDSVCVFRMQSIKLSEIKCRWPIWGEECFVNIFIVFAEIRNKRMNKFTVVTFQTDIIGNWHMNCNINKAMCIAMEIVEARTINSCNQRYFCPLTI